MTSNMNQKTVTSWSKILTSKTERGIYLGAIEVYDKSFFKLHSVLLFYISGSASVVYSNKKLHIQK